MVLRSYGKINLNFSVHVNQFLHFRLDWIEPVEEDLIEDLELLAASEGSNKKDGKRKENAGNDVALKKSKHD